MDSTVVRCAEGHEFRTSTFPMQNLGTERIGPGRLLRCPGCARLRQAVPVPVAVPERWVREQAQGQAQGRGA